jgi:head-tail adaptor
LDRYVTLQRLPDPNDPDAPRNDYGELTSEPEDDLTNIRSTRLERVGSQEFPEAQKRHTDTTGRFRIRYRGDINTQTLSATHRLKYIEDYRSSPQVIRYYNITDANIIGRFEEIHIEVSEVR